MFGNIILCCTCRENINKLQCGKGSEKLMNMEIFQGLSQKEQKSYIDKLDWAYYNEDNSLVSDAEYDEYRRIYENKYGDLNYVSGVPSKDFESFKHPIKCLIPLLLNRNSTA